MSYGLVAFSLDPSALARSDIKGSNRPTAAHNKRQRRLRLHLTLIAVRYCGDSPVALATSSGGATNPEREIW
ncbi:hypothetical protein SKP52_11690 [Sphingopyxis fribergensis]|uniref:Uncharacterized protein n=1 Tax=Sphingopyxis fribergensis TaxID=1515612 RepID=A0A0A7PGX4_9SPHN|nr:hypothetical protein SKP52_11690 [Sphingopyxis fribergensis]